MNLEKRSIFYHFNYQLSLILTIQLQNRIFLTIKLSKLFIFSHPAVFEGWFHCHGRHVAIEPIDQLFCLSSLSSLSLRCRARPRGWRAGKGACMFPGTGCRGGRLHRCRLQTCPSMPTSRSSRPRCCSWAASRRSVSAAPTESTRCPPPRGAGQAAMA